MDRAEYLEMLVLKQSLHTVKATELGDPRTLLFGYNSAKNSFHVYLDGGLVHRLIYTWREEILVHCAGAEFDIRDMVPDKRVYPLDTDFEFAKRALAMGVEIPFLPWDPERETNLNRFKGLVCRDC